MADERQSPQADSPPSDPSVTRWLAELERGDHTAARHLWGLLHERLLQAARKEVARSSPQAYDEEDVALSAFDTLCRVIQDGSYTFTSRNELWRFATAIAVNKARNRAQHENRIRRGGGVERLGSDTGFLDAIVSPEPTAEVSLMMQEECQQLLARLKRREVQLVALLKLDGYTNEEVADRLGCTRRSVQRRLALIRDIWSEDLG